jgi:hypothetical protein
METWAKAKFTNDLFWEYTSNITAEGFTAPSQSLVPIEIKRARHNYYFIIRSGDYGVHNAPYARQLLKIANTNLDTLGVSKSMPSRLPTSELLSIVNADKARALRAELQSPD